jgi:hypothetical protein
METGTHVTIFLHLVSRLGVYGLSLTSAYSVRFSDTVLRAVVTLLLPYISILQT